MPRQKKRKQKPKDFSEAQRKMYGNFIEDVFGLAEAIVNHIKTNRESAAKPQGEKQESPHSSEEQKKNKLPKWAGY